MTQDNTNSQEWDKTLSTPESEAFLKKSSQEAQNEFEAGSVQSLEDFEKELGLD